ncbi:MAG: hypothetical protein H0X45_01465 [Planctomycetes bacterium]|nr:hypothetical protein [Planctomycetota bacterium]
MSDFRDTWLEQCDAAGRILEEFGLGKAIGYLVGEKLLNSLKAARTDPDVAGEIPAFAARIREVFAQHELSAWFASVGRLGPLGHCLSADEHRDFLAAGGFEETAVQGAEDVLALERAKALLLR